MATGNVTPLEGVVPKAKLREVVSYELSPMWTRSERYNPDELVGRRGLRIYSAMMIDEQVKAVCQFKRDAITSRGWTFAYEKDCDLSPDEQSARIKIMQSAVALMRGSFEDALNAIARGRHYGYALVEKVHDIIHVDGKEWVGIHSLLSRDPATFTFYTDAWGTLEKVIQRMNGVDIEVDIGKFIHYVHAPEEDRYYGASDLRQAHRAWYAKDQLVKMYLTYLERFAGGFAVMSMKEGAGITQGTPEYVAMQGVLRNLRQASGLIVPSGVEFKMEMPGTTGEYREALTYFDLSIAKALLVPNLLGLSHAGQTGSYSQSQTQLEAFFWTINADTRRLEACLNEQLFYELGEMNWGDGEYPCFRFNPASQEQVRWTIGMWKDLVGAKAVQATEADEDHLRELLDMPARSVEEDDIEAALKSDPSAAFTGVQITAMLDILQRVGEGKLPKESAVLALIQSFPMSEEDARALLEPIVEGGIKPEPPPMLGVPPAAEKPPAPSASDALDAEDAPDDSADEPPAPKVVAHTHDGQPRTVTMSTFLRAAQRVDFAVIERRHAALSDATVEELSKLMARAAWRILGDEAKMKALTDSDPADIEFVKFDGADIGKLKACCKSGLQRGWSVGAESAQREVAKARQPAEFRVNTLRGAAADYLEANGFRMAANMSDAARSIIQQELLASVKSGADVSATAAQIYARMVERGLVTLRDVDAETGSTTLMDGIAARLGKGVETANVAHYLETLVRTNTFEALNEARFASFTDPALEGFVEGFEYSAILDDRTTEICAALDGMQMRADDEEWNSYRPPNHYNCRSILIPITQADGWDGVSDDVPSGIEPSDGFG